MKPSSNSFSSNTYVESYEEGLRNRKKQYQAELTDLIAKVKGSSLKSEDKNDILKDLMLTIANSVEPCI